MKPGRVERGEERGSSMLVVQDRLLLRRGATSSYAPLSFVPIPFPSCCLFLSFSPNSPFLAKCKTRVRKFEKTLREKGVPFAMGCRREETRDPFNGWK